MYQLSFRSSPTSPTYDPTANHYLILSRCEGYNLVNSSFDENVFFICFVGWVDGQLQAYHTDDYVAWAILPNSAEIIEESFGTANLKRTIALPPEQGRRIHHGSFIEF